MTENKKQPLVHTKYDHLFEVSSKSVKELLRVMKFSSHELKGKVVLITGGARGIGAEMVEGLAYLGAKVFTIDYREEGHEVVRKVCAAGGDAIFIQKDISISENLIAALEQAGDIDILINNAVHFPLVSFADMPMEEWDLTFNTNLRAMALAAKHVLPAMIAKGSGVVFNMVALEGMAYAAAMSSSKVGMRSLLFSLAAEIPPETGVHILGFAPGLVATPLVKEVFIPYSARIGIDFEDYVLDISHNPGYKGLMPVEHCAAAAVHAMLNAEEHHGLVVSPYATLDNYDIISIDEYPEPEKRFDFGNASKINEFIDEVAQMNTRIEHRINVRTRELLKKQEELNESLKKTNERLVDSNASLDSFNYHISHDIKTILTNVSSLCSMIHKYNAKGDVEKVEDLQQRITQVISNGNETMNAFMQLGQADGQFNTEKIDIHVPNRINHILEVNNFKADVDLHLENFDLNKLFMNEKIFDSIFLNLISNSVKYSSEKAQIYVGLSCEKDLIEIHFRDKGVGIDLEKHKADLFQPFKRLDRNVKVEGSGIGLYLVKRCVHNYNGSIRVASKIGEGTSFFLSFPKQEITISQEQSYSHQT